MVKSLGDYNIEQSSSTDVNNIKWSKKIQTESKPKIKRKKPFLQQILSLIKKPQKMIQLLKKSSKSNIRQIQKK